MRFRTRIIRYQETVNKKRIFRKDNSVIINRSRYETIEEVFVRVTAWLNKNRITNPHINTVPSRIDPCIGCLTEPNWVGKNPYKISNYTCVIEVFVMYEKPDESSDDESEEDSTESSSDTDKNNKTPKVIEAPAPEEPITPVIKLAEENVSSSTSEL